MTDEVVSGVRGISDVGLHQTSSFQCSIRYDASSSCCSFGPLETVASVQNREVGNADLVWIAIDDSWQAEVSGVDFLFGDVELIIAAIV